MKVSRIAKVAAASLVGFCAVSLAADKVNVAPMLSQLAGFVGAFFGSLAASNGTRTTGRSRREAIASQGDQSLPPAANDTLAALTESDVVNRAQNRT